MNIILIFSFCMGFSNPKKTNIDPPTNDPGCTVDVTLNHLSCKTEGVSSNDGSISVVATVTSGTTAIKWTSNTTSTLVPNKWEQLDLMAGEYTIEVFHQGTSVYKKTHVLQAPDNFEATIVKTDNHCYQGEDGSIAITATGGTPPYLYSIDDGQTYHSSSVFQQLPKKDYKVKIKDIKGCMITKNVSISQGAYLSVNHPPDLEVADCLNQEDIDLAFQEWLDKFVHYGGTKPLQENFSHQAIPSPCGGSIKVTYTVVDDCGVEKTCEATFTVPQKTTLNFTTQAQPLTISCEENTQAIIQQWLASNGHAEASSNCSLVWTNDYTDQQWDNSCENSKSITVNFTASNGCENQQTSAIITVEDKQAPIFAEALPEDLTVSCQTIPEPAILTAADNCDQDVSVVFEESQSTDGCLSTITRIWTATDCAGNTAKHTQIITVEDKQAPIFAEALPEDLTVSCQTIPEPAILTATDNCDQDVSVVFEETQSTDGCLSTITRIWTSTDCAGNTAKHTQTITVEDKQAPIFAEALPEDLTIGCQTIPEPTILTATDNCDKDVSVVFEETQSTDGCLSTITRIWTATDCAGNTAKHTQIIVKNQDQQPPKLAAVSEGYQKDITISCGLIPPAPKLEFTDNCTGELTQDYSENSTAIQDNGSYQIIRLWKVSDPCGNTAEFNQTIHVTPNRKLSFNQLPEDLTVNCGAIPEPEILIATTGCNTSAPVTLDEQFSQTDCTHLIERTWSATDDQGTVISHTQTITIEDRQAPVFVEPLPEDLNLTCTSLPEAVVLTAVDQCDENVMVHMEETTSLNGCTENIKRVWTATDCSGNSVSHTQNIKLLHDTEPPVLTNTSIEHFQSTVNVSCSNIPEVPDLEFQDQCSEKLQINFEQSSTYVNDQTNYEIHRIWTVSDPCKNQATFTQTINVSQGNTQSELEQLMLCQQDVVYDLNDLLPTESDLSGQWTLITDHPYLNGSFFDPTTAELGAYQAHYTLENSCTPQRIVTITVHDDCVVLACDSSDSINISKAITPNGDAYNEYFTVSGLEECGFKLELRIFNRWGNKIFESMDYQNNWNAFSNSGSSHFVPAGTYYYILTVVDSGYDPIKGYLYVGTTAK